MTKEIAALMNVGNRSKAYLQMLGKEGLCPSYCIIMTDDIESLIQEKIEYVPTEAKSDFFLTEEPILYTLEKYRIPYEICKTNTVNDSKVIAVLERLDQEYIIYSGFGGEIVKKKILQVGKKLLHIHPGILPYFRGSTTVYYSLLEEGSCGATAFFLDKEIDTGDIISMNKYPIPDNVPNMDYVFDPYIRAMLLVDVVKKYCETGRFSIKKQELKSGETYFIIRPVLKHIAIIGELETKRR